MADMTEVTGKTDLAAISGLCVFCGSNPGKAPEYAAAAQALGRLLAQENITLVYGGASVGLMGEVAGAALAHGGTVVGVIPDFMLRGEIAHPGLSELVVVASMHERKAAMAELADGFIALPGGMGTLEEFCEAVTWARIGLHRKPCGLLNAHGFYSPFVSFLDSMAGQGFIREDRHGLILVEDTPEKLLCAMRAFTPAATGRVPRPGRT